MEEFAIIHNTEQTQILIQKDYDSESEKYKLLITFMPPNLNGMCEVGLSYEKEEVRDADFIALKDKEKALNTIGQFLK